MAGLRIAANTVNPSKVFLGANEYNKIYQGPNLIWQKLINGRVGVLYEDPFNSLVINNWSTTSHRGWNQIQAAVPASDITIVSDISRMGGSAMRVVCNSNAPYNGSYRSEIRFDDDNTLNGWERWIGFSTYLPASYVSDLRDNILFQMHASEDANDVGNSPSICFNIRSGIWQMITTYSAAATQTGSDDANLKIDMGAVATEQWDDWVVYVKFAWDSTGIVKVWRNNTLVVNYTGPNTFNDARPPYLKLGLYIDDWADDGVDVATQRVAYYDEFRYADHTGNYNSVYCGNFDDTLYFTHKYLADNAYVYGDDTTLATNGQFVSKVKDLIGTKDWAYSGNAAVALTTGRPTYFKPVADKPGYVYFDNALNQSLRVPYESRYNPAITTPKEHWFVLLRPCRAAQYEAYMNTYQGGYIADAGSNNIRLHNDNADTKSIDGSATIPMLSKSIVRLKANGSQSEVYINNVRVNGPLTGGYFDDGHNATWSQIGIGADSHNADWDWFASYVKTDGILTEDQATTVYNALAARHDVGATPDKPYASDITVTRVGHNYSVSYTYNSPNGVPENTAAAEFEFIYAGRSNSSADIPNSYIVTALNNVSPVNRVDYGIGNSLGNPELFYSVAPYAWFRLRVKVYDTNGDSWRFQSSAWKFDNEGQTGNITPTAPTVAGDDTINQLTATHGSYANSEIVYSENGGAWTTYTGAISVGDVARAAGYWVFKIKEAFGRNESAIASSPAFTISTAPPANDKFDYTFDFNLS